MRNRSRATRTSLLRALTLTAWLSLPLVAAHAEEVEDPSGTNVSLGSGGLKVETNDGRFKFKFGGRLHADGSYHAGDTPGDIPPNPPSQPDPESRKPTDGAEVRRARLVAKATVYEDWEWVGEVDFADNDAALKDFALGYSGFENTTISVGHQKQPYSLSLEMSSNDIPFVERSPDNDLNVLVDRAIGLRVDTHGDHWFFAAGVYGDSAEPQKENGAEGWGVAARAIVAPIRESDRVLHLGFRTAYRRPDEPSKDVRFRDETTHMSNYHVVDTGTLSNVDNTLLYGPEAALAYGPVWVFGEYSRAQVQRNGFRTSDFESGHIAAAWMLTGESRAATYSMGSGEFKAIKPKDNFSLKNGNWGAFELATRYSYINLNDGSSNNPGSVFGGREQILSTAFNWYVNPNVRFMFNWNYILETNVSSKGVDRVSTKEAEGFNVLTLRAQLNF